MAIARVSRITQSAPTLAVSSATNTNKTLQSQLQMKQQTLNKLSNNSSMNAAEKEKERQKLEAEIEELKRKLELLRQKQEEAQKEKISEIKENSPVQNVSETQNETKRTEEDSTSKSQSKEHKSEPVEMSSKEIHQMLDRNFTLKEDMVQQGVAYDKENYVRKLTSEIRQDKLYGLDTSAKEKELEDLQKQDNLWAEATNKNNIPENQPLINPDVQVII